MVNEQDMEKALDALDRQLIPNYAEIGKIFGIERITLMRRHKGISTSKQEATSIHHKLLTDTQEEALINQINKLIIRGLSSIIYIIKNLIEEIIRYNINKN